MAVEVNFERTTSRDVTEEYVDLSARLGNLEATKVQLEKLLEHFDADSRPQKGADRE